MEKDLTLIEEEKFEKELFQSLKFFGYVFPTTVADIERLDTLYGDTVIEMPIYLERLEDIRSNSLDQDIQIKMAAFKSKRKSLDIPDDDIEPKLE